MSKEKYEKAITAHKVAVAQVKAATEGQKSFGLAVVSLMMYTQ